MSRNGLGCEGGRADELQLVSAEERGILSWRVGYRGRAKELLHLSRRCESNQHSTRLFAYRREGVGDAARTQYGISSAQLNAAIADLKDHLTFDDIKPLFLMEVKVKRWATFGQVGVFNDEQSVVGVAGHYFEKDGTVSARALFAKPVLTGGHKMNLAGGRRRR